jgi:hypothetical protein
MKPEKFHRKSFTYGSLMPTRDTTGLIRARLASAVIAAAASGWGCSSSVEPTKDSGPSDARLYSLFQFAPANISDSSASAAHRSYDDPPMVRRGSTDPRWVRVGEAYFFSIDNQVLIIRRVLDRQ